MPSTCADGGGVSTIAHARFQPAKAKSVEHCTKLHNAIHCLTNESYKQVLHDMVCESLASVGDVFDSDGVGRELERLREVVAQGSHSTLCAVFFLLLNVDAGLKDRIVAMESDANGPKMARFLVDLRNVLAVRFFTDERCTPILFVEESVDCYLVS